MNKRKWIVSVVTSLLILFVGAIISQKMKAQKQSTLSDAPIKEEIYYVQAANFPAQPVKSKINIDGRLNAFEKIDISAEVSGRLLPGNKTWRKGSYFKKGQLLFQVDSEGDRLNLFAQRSSLLNAITQIMPDLKFDYPDAFQKWKAYLDAFEIKNTTPELPATSTEQEKYFVAGKNLYNLYYSIKSAEDRLKDFNVYAPFSGVFLSVNVYPGALVNPGASLGRLMNTSKYELETPIAMKDFELIKAGQKVELMAEDLGKTYQGTISRISTQIDQATQSIPVFITVTGLGLRDGMYLKGSLSGTSLADVSTLPIEAIVNQNLIYVVRDSIIYEKEVDVILSTDQEVLVRGVQATDDVIIKGLNSLSPGQKAATIKS